MTDFVALDQRVRSVLAGADLDAHFEVVQRGGTPEGAVVVDSVVCILPGVLHRALDAALRENGLDVQLRHDTTHLVTVTSRG